MKHPRRSLVVILAAAAVWAVSAGAGTAAGQIRRNPYRPSGRRPVVADPVRSRFETARGPLFNPALAENRYIGFGDSITFGTINHLDTPELGYIPRLKILLEGFFGPTDIYNEGVGGEETTQGLLRIGGVINARQARYILILEGTNDVTFLRSASTVASNLRSMLQACLDEGMLPSVATIIPRLDARSIDPYLALQKDINSRIRTLAAELAVPLVDLYNVFLQYSGGGAAALLSEDLKHPNERGYQVMAEQWAASIHSYPFPPVSIQVRKELDQILFYHREGNRLSWAPNPNIGDPSLIQGIKIYRRKQGEGVDDFQLIALLSGPAEYFDTNIEAGVSYEYALAALRTDGIEGPCSELVII